MLIRSLLWLPPAHKKKERENDAVREKANVSLIYITRLIQSNMAIHQWGSQWQAITVLPGTSAPCLCCWCCSSMGPQLPNSSWKQYLYIYHIFTQYLPFRKTMSYLTISLPVPPPPPLQFGSFHAASFFHPHLSSLSFGFSAFCAFFFLLHISISFFNRNFFPSSPSFYPPCISMKLDFSALPRRTITAAIAISEQRSTSLWEEEIQETGY